MKGAIAAGHTETAKSAAEVLQDGGNAFDAVVAAHMAACVAEPVLSSFGGGGFLVARAAGQKAIVYDFFAQTPLHKKSVQKRSFYPISADFGDASQEFHIGAGSMATPGTVKGLFQIHRDLCSLPFFRLAEPAIERAKNGIIMNAFQALVLDIVKPIFQSNKEVKKLYSGEDGEALICEGERFRLPQFADFLEVLAREGESFFYEGEVAASLAVKSRELGGHLTAEDFKKYSVQKRDPLQFQINKGSVLINPPPSSGGILIAFSSKICEAVGLQNHPPGSVEYVQKLAEVQRIVNRARIDQIIENPEANDYSRLLEGSLLDRYKSAVYQKFSSQRGTTHISVADRWGNLASLTTSNGEGSGILIPGTSIMMNNMLGEEDLFSGGFGEWKPDQRISSMMAPGILKMQSGDEVVFGSGGSNRIRTAILQVLLNITASCSIEESVRAPRIHVEKNMLNVEAGFGEKVIAGLKAMNADTKVWSEKSLFFGGVHLVQARHDSTFSGCGDPRRGGVFINVE